jgi:hypothetical protein
MDALTGLLDGPRARGAFLLRSVLDPPWSLRIQDGSPLSLITLVRGEAWILKQHATPVRVEPGDVAVVTGIEPYSVADSPGTAPQIIIHPGQRCESADGTEMTMTGQGVRTWGTAPDGAQPGAEEDVDGDQRAAETGPIGDQVLKVGNRNGDERRCANAADEGERVDMPGLIGKSQ